MLRSRGTTLPGICSLSLLGRDGADGPTEILVDAFLWLSSLNTLARELLAVSAFARS